MQVAIRIPLSSEQFHFNNNKRQALRQQRLEQLRQQEHSDTQQYQGAVLVLQRQISELRLQVCYVEGGCFRELCTRPKFAHHVPAGPKNKRPSGRAGGRHCRVRLPAGQKRPRDGAQ
eukprot:8398875-Pyramimonas_sp.AAC.1